MSNGLQIVGRVEGSVRFPEHPDRDGAWGLVGGEDVYALRASFRTVNEAARWCWQVLTGEVNPRWQAAGELLTPRTDPLWSSASITVTYGDESRRWISADGEEWKEAK